MINNCPFCGNSNVMSDVKTSKTDGGKLRYTHYVRCKNCHARGPVVKADCLIGKDKSHAITLWNGGAKN